MRGIRTMHYKLWKIGMNGLLFNGGLSNPKKVPLWAVQIVIESELPVEVGEEALSVDL